MGLGLEGVAVCAYTKRLGKTSIFATTDLIILILYLPRMCEAAIKGALALPILDLNFAVAVVAVVLFALPRRSIIGRKSIESASLAPRQLFLSPHIEGAAGEPHSLEREGGGHEVHSGRGNF